MSLTGLLGTVAEDPQLQRALRYAALPGSDGAELIAPPALRPVLVAALAAEPASASATRTVTRVDSCSRSPRPPGKPRT